jgi:hypothetical protein
MKIFQARKQSSDSRRGGAMVMAAFAISTMSVLAMSMVTIQVSSTVEQNRAQAESRAVLAAEAGLSRAYMNLQNGGSGNLGSNAQPLALASGEVSVVTQAYSAPSKLIRVLATGRTGNSDARAELILHDNNTSIFVWGAFGDTSLKMSSQAKIDS